MDALEEYPKTAWLIEKVVGTLFVCMAGWALRSCWRHMRANQKLALGDAVDYVASERRGLLLPIHHGGTRRH